MRRSGRSLLFSQLTQAFNAARRENQRRAGIRPSAITRRHFLAGAAGGLIATYARRSQAAQQVGSIAVVGAGIAGLNATYLLANAGLNVALYEGSNHIGGRIQTKANAVAPGVDTELGAEFIDSDQEDMLALVKMFGFSLIDTESPDEARFKPAYFAQGRLWSDPEIIEALQPLVTIVDRDRSRLSDVITFENHSRFDAALDRTSLRQYLARNVKVSWLYDILEEFLVAENGLDLDDQSSLNFVTVLGTDTSEGLYLYGRPHQRYKVRGGNHQIVAALADGVRDRISFGQKLEAIDQRRNGQYVLSFATDSGNRTVVADFVVLCLPFTILRDIAVGVPLPPIKKKVIQELGYGANSKLILGFQDRPWRTDGYSGDAFADLPFKSGWDSSRGQPTPRGAYTFFPGGSQTPAFEIGSPQQQAERVLPGLGQIFPGVQQRWLGTAIRANWPKNPFIRASYSGLLPGQWTGLRGAAGFPVGNLYFAGEHTSLDSQGYMNGGAETGRLAAQALIGLLA